MGSYSTERLARRRERRARLDDLADTLDESAGDHDPSTARLLHRMADQLHQVATVLVPEDYPSADFSRDQLTL